MRNRTTNQRGAASIIEILVVMAVSFVLLGAVTATVIAMMHANSRQTVRTEQESAAVTILNRIARDVSDASTVLEAGEAELVVAIPAGATHIKRVYYGVQGSELLTWTTAVPSSASFDPDLDWTTNDVSVLGRQVKSGTGFEYVDRTGATTSTPADVRRVDITYRAGTQVENISNSEDTGLVELTTSAAVDSSLAGASGPDVPGSGCDPVDPNCDNDSGPDNLPVAIADAATIVKGYGSDYVEVLDNDFCNNGENPCSPASLSSGPTITTPMPAGITVSDLGMGTYVFTVASSYSGASTVVLEYTFSDPYGTTTPPGTITLTITEPDVVLARAWPDSAPSSVAQTTGTDVVSWTGGTGPYAIYRRNNNAGAWVQMSPGSGYPGGSGTQTRNFAAELGANYTYKVVGNNGSSAVTGNSAGTDNSVQYPPVPTIQTLGSDVDGDGIAESLTWNQVAWSAPTGTFLPANASRQINRYYRIADSAGAGAISASSRATASAWSTSTSGCIDITTPTCFVDTARVAGTETIYSAWLRVSCDPDLPSGDTWCYSFQSTPAFDFGSSGSGGNVAYQAPSVAPEVTLGQSDAAACADAITTVSADDNNQVFSCADNKARMGWTAVPDAGAAATGKFCSFTSEAPCTVRTLLSEATASGAVAQGTNAVITTGTSRTAITRDGSTIADGQRWNAPGGWGSKSWMQVTACNPGGCGPAGAREGYSWSGTFTVSGTEIGKYQNDHEVGNIKSNASPWCTTYSTAACKTKESSSVRIKWSGSNGVDSYKTQVEAISGLCVECTPVTGWLDPVSADGTSAAVAGTQSRIYIDGDIGKTTSELKRDVGISPSTTYVMRVRATSSKGLTLVRQSTATATTGPAHVRFFNDGTFCSRDSGQKGPYSSYALGINTNLRFWRSSDDSNRNANAGVDHIRWVMAARLGHTSAKPVLTRSSTNEFEAYSTAGADFISGNNPTRAQWNNASAGATQWLHGVWAIGSGTQTAIIGANLNQAKMPVGTSAASGVRAVQVVTADFGPGEGWQASLQRGENEGQNATNLTNCGTVVANGGRFDIYELYSTNTSAHLHESDYTAVPDAFMP